MAIPDLLWACPACGGDATLRVRGRGAACTACGARLERLRDGRISLIELGEQGRRTDRTAGEWTRILPIPEAAGQHVDPGAGGESAPHDVAVVRRASVVMRVATGAIPLKRSGEYLGAIERMGERQSGTLTLTTRSLEFSGDTGTITWLLDELTAVQPSSSSLQIKARGRPVVSVRFPSDSPRLWEILLTNGLRELYRSSGRGEILEFQPRIVTQPPSALASSVADRLSGTGQPSPNLASHVASEERGGDAVITISRPRRPPIPAARRASQFNPARGYRSIQVIVASLWRSLAGLTVTGTENIPRTGPFILVANHQSVLDPILVQAVCPRVLNTMAKSTQFGAPVLGRIMAYLHSFPVRRFQIDPQAVRIALRRLQQGQGVCVYPEGERSWDGALQPFRLGTLRLILKAGVPVVPCGIRGTYEAWPRWDRRLALGPVSITFGEAIEFPALHARADRERALESAADTIAAAISQLI